MTSNDVADDNFKNETSKPMEITIPVEVTAAIRIWLDPGEELTAEMVNDAVDQFAAAAADDDFRHPKLSHNVTIGVLGIDEDAKMEYYSDEASGEIAPPDGVDFVR